MPGTTKPPREDFFNDLSRDMSGSDQATPPSPKEADGAGRNNGSDNYVPRPKRIACILCRKRKLKCDGGKPACGTCSRLGHDCAYDEQRKKSGPKRGYVKLLEQRLKQVENLLGSKGNEAATQSEQIPVEAQQQDFQPNVDKRGPETIMDPFTNPGFDATSMDMMPDLTMTGADDFSWELLSLGLDEPLPLQDIIDDMNQIYFEKIHPSLPMIHRARFLASMDLAPHMRPPVCLRYAMWTQACSVTPRYSQLQDHFYARSRKYAEADEMRGHGEMIITLAHAQAWALLAAFEFKMMYFPRAWMSCGRSTRLTQMMGLHRCDGVGLDVKQCLPPPRDWIEREERRRTFWMAFCNDRYASIGTGWPMTFDEQDILTNLPASEEAFNKGTPEQTPSLSEVMIGDGASQLSPFGGVILMATLFGRNLTHLHRPTPEDRDHDLNGEFWKRHRALDNILLNTSLSMPSNLRLPAGIFSANIVFLNMNIHTSTICLHQAAIFKADKNRMTAQISAESKRRCIIAADQITNIMKMISHVDLSTVSSPQELCLQVLTSSDEPIHGFLPIRCRASVRTIPQIAERRRNSHVLIALSFGGNAGHEIQKPSNRVIPRPIGRRP
jgi:Fungal specific transcription factor domain/Fungal Zn(2)-Cys(6) binuclear cluster domain